MPFRQPPPAAPPPPPPPRKAFTVVSQIGYGSVDASPQYHTTISATAVVVGAQGLVDYIGFLQAQVVLEYADDATTIRSKIESALRAQTGDPALICVMVT